MVEIQRGMGGASGSDRLPWLEPVEDEDFGGGPGAPGGYGGVIVTVIAVLIGITMVTAAIVWFRHHRAATADIGGVIKAPAGPYKVKPPESGGLKTDQVGEVASDTGAGHDIDGMLDLNAVPEEPIVRRGKPQQTQPAPQQQPQQSAPPVSAPQPAPRAEAKAPPPAPIPSVVAAPPVPAAPARPDKPAAPPKPAFAGGGTIQLGAFSSEAKAKTAWKTLSTRFVFLHDMNMGLQPVQSGDTTLYRLRASGGGEPAGQMCVRLKIAGETCAVVGN